MGLVTLADVRAAAKVLDGVAVRTPVVAFPGVQGLWLKQEQLQPIGAFKVRGAYYAISRIPAARRAKGVITHSSGNHGQAVAYAARALGIPALVVMPDDSVQLKIDRVRELGAETVLVPVAERFSVAERLTAERGLTFVPPYDHPDVLAGQGTVGLEIAEDVPDVEVVLAPVGGGGLVSGVAVAVKALRPGVAVIGVEPELAADARDSRRAGHLVEWPVEQRVRTLADGLRTSLSELTLRHITALVDDIVTVSDDEIRATVGELARRADVVAEPSGAVTTAAYLHHRGELPAGKTVAVVSGGNIDPELFRTLVTQR
ncbi:MAG: threonine ammonia-lyase [Micromonosporaceae bacterium]